MTAQKKYTLYKRAILPIILIEDVEALSLKKNLKNKVYAFLVNLKNNYYDESKHQVNEFVFTPKTYLQKHFGNSYVKIRNLLEEKGIIIINHKYYNSKDITIKGYCKSIKLNSKYYYVSYMCSNFASTHCKSISYAIEIDNKSTPEKSAEQASIDNLKLLKINIKPLRDIAEWQVDSINISNFLVDEQITKKFFYKVHFFSDKKDRTYQMRLKIAKERANKNSLNLIQDKDRLYVMSIESFISMKKNAVMTAYMESIDNLENRAFYADRNDTNHRLDTNITNMPSVLVKEILRQNNLISLDLKNSQFAILSHLFKNTNIANKEDFQCFYEHASIGSLYTYIQDNLDFSSRKEAKQSMFELMFSSHNFRSPLKSKLKKIFPNVIKAINDFKKEKTIEIGKEGFKEFAIWLQKFESELFIDKIFVKINKKGIFSITKHDSIIIKEKDRNKVDKIIKGIFKEMEFRGNIIKE